MSEWKLLTATVQTLKVLPMVRLFCQVIYERSSAIPVDWMPFRGSLGDLGLVHIINDLPYKVLTVP